MCFMWIWEQTAIISPYSINRLVFVTETECVYWAVRTGSLYIVQGMCFMWIWEQTAIISQYSINRVVFVTETECVYCAVRTGCIILVNLCRYWLRCASLFICTQYVFCSSLHAVRTLVCHLCTYVKRAAVWNVNLRCHLGSRLETVSTATVASWASHNEQPLHFTSVCPRVRIP